MEKKQVLSYLAVTVKSQPRVTVTVNQNLSTSRLSIRVAKIIDIGDL